MSKNFLKNHEVIKTVTVSDSNNKQLKFVANNK